VGQGSIQPISNNPLAEEMGKMSTLDTVADLPFGALYGACTSCGQDAYRTRSFGPVSHSDSGEAECQEDTVSGCACAACIKAAEITGQPGTTPFNGPFVGRPQNKLHMDDTVRSSGAGPHVLGKLGWLHGQFTVKWDDRDCYEPLAGGMVVTLLRAGELPSVPGAGLMPINGELVEM
jgi:hypothetical protein